MRMIVTKKQLNKNSIILDFEIVQPDKVDNAIYNIISGEYYR